MPNTNSCCCGASPVSCCKMLWVFVLDDFFRCLHSFLSGSCCLLRILYFDLRCEHLPVCHPKSSQNESCGWLQLPDSIQFAQNPFKLDFNPKQLVCKYPKSYFRVIPLFHWIMKEYKISYNYIYISIYILCIYIYICILYQNIVLKYAKIHPGTDEHRDADRTGAIRWCLGENSGQNGSFGACLAVFM